MNYYDPYQTPVTWYERRRVQEMIEAQWRAGKTITLLQNRISRKVAEIEQELILVIVIIGTRVGYGRSQKDWQPWESTAQRNTVVPANKVVTTVQQVRFLPPVPCSRIRAYILSIDGCTSVRYTKYIHFITHTNMHTCKYALLIVTAIIFICSGFAFGYVLGSHERLAPSMQVF